MTLAQTLAQWADKQPWRLEWFDSRFTAAIPDTCLVGRTEAWYLEDYRVSSVSGGSIWLTQKDNDGGNDESL